MSSTRNAVLLLLALVPAAAAAPDLRSLLESYQSLKARYTALRDASEQRALNEEEIRPVLLEIGKLRTPEAAAFLRHELDTAEPHLAASCPPALLEAQGSGALSILLKGFAARAAPVRRGILEALARSQVDLAPGARMLLEIARTESDPEAKPALPGAVGRLDTVRATRTLLSRVEPPGDATRRPRPPARGAVAPAGPPPEGQYLSAVVVALVGTRSDEVRKWLSGPAFRDAGSSAEKLEVVARVAGRLGLEEARPHLEKLLELPEGRAQEAALESLAKIGVDPSLAAVIRAVERSDADIRFLTRALDALAGAGSEKAEAVVLAFSRNKDPAVRAIAKGSLARLRSPRALEALVAGLEDSDPNVRSATLVALGAKRDKAMITPLIAHLTRETQERLRLDCLKLLVGVTGINLGFVGADWKKWWETAEPTFRLPDEVDPELSRTAIRRARREDIKIVPRYFGMEVTTTDRVAFLVDVSGSMAAEVALAKGGSATKIEVLKKELSRVISGLPGTTYINVVAFNAGFNPWKKGLQSLRGRGRSQALAYVQRLSAGGLTNVFDTLQFALSDRQVDTIFLLSDGLPTAGRITDPAAIRREIDLINRARGATIHCIAFGADSSFLKSLARENRGEYRYVSEF